MGRSIANVRVCKRRMFADNFEISYYPKRGRKLTSEEAEEPL